MDQVQIKCPVCGEMYSSTYRRCPFCEEDGEAARKITFTPTRHVSDRHKQQSALGGIIAVAVLVVGLLGWYFFGGNAADRGGRADSGKDKPVISDQQPAVPVSNPNAGTATDPFYQPQNETPDAGDTTLPDASGEGSAEPVSEEPPAPPVEENVDVSAAKLNREDFTLSGVGDSFRVKVSGTEATPHWSIDNANVASLSADGTVTAVANGRTTLHCKVGTRDLTCIVRVNNTGRTAEPAAAPTSVEPVTPTAPATPGTAATSPAQTQGDPAQSTAQPETTPAAPSTTHVDASSLSVKTNYGTTLQKDPDTGYPDCTVRIGGDPIALRISGTDVPVSSWTSDKTSVVEVSADGKLTPVSSGTAHVTAVVGDATIVCIIRVR